MEFWLRKMSAEHNRIIMLYKIDTLDTLNFAFNSPISPSPLPEEGGDENILVKITGNTNTMTLSWVIKEENVNRGIINTNVSNLVSPCNSKTVLEQLMWFTKPDHGFLGTGIDDSFDIVIVEDGAHSGDYWSDELNQPTSNESVRKGYIRNLSFDTSGSEPVTLKARLDFIEGNTITGYNGNTPSTPRNFVVQKGDASGNDKDTKMYITWTLPLKNGGSNLTAQAVYSRESEGEWKANAVASNAEAAVISNLTSGTTYDFKVISANINGNGTPTYVRSRTTD
jgi:hypothetical protein